MNIPKVLVYCIDGVGPNTIFKYLDDWPTYKKVAIEGAHGTMQCHTTSPTSWASFYLGVPEDQHGLTPANGVGKAREGLPLLNIQDRKAGLPIWEHLNNNNIPVGLYKSYYTGPDYDVNGFMIYSDPKNDKNKDNAPAGYNNFPSLNNICQHVYKHNRRGKPRMPELTDTFNVFAKGKNWHQVSDADRNSIVQTYFPYRQYHNLLEYYEWHTPLECEAMKQLYQHKPVNFLMTYSHMTDYVQHYQFHEPNLYTIRQAYQMAQRRLEGMIEFYNPDYILILSDHGIKPIVATQDGKYSCGHINGQPAATTRDGYTVTQEDRLQGALISADHSVEGIYIFSGPRIKKGFNKEIKNHNLYKVLCDIYGIDLPDSCVADDIGMLEKVQKEAL